MFETLRPLARKIVNAPLALVGLEVRSSFREHDWDDPEQYIPFRETIDGAKQAGLSVGDYIDTTYNKPGATQKTIDQMEGLGVFRDKIERVCEIGPGSGRYLEKTIKACNPDHYEIYETASVWAEYVVGAYGVIARPTDGLSLGHTDSESIDLIHAHKVLVCTPFITTCRYLGEMARVLRSGGKAVFDLVTEDCMDDPTVDAWIEAGSQSGSYPNLMPKQYVTDYLSRRGLSLGGSFFVPMEPGRTECFVFSKRAPA
jgi:hypothetical protein